MSGEASKIERVVVVLPTWVGDVAMATPTLRALRTVWPGAHVAGFVREAVAPVIDACPWLDAVATFRPGKHLEAIGALRRGRYDAAVLLPNSFRSALWTRLGKVRRRIGYKRDGRGLLLTDRLLPPRDERGKLAPTPAIDYYLALARYLGADDAVARDRRMALHTREADDAAARAALTDAIGDLRNGPIVLLNPGAATKGGAKLWPGDRFAAVADRLIAERGARVLVNGAPTERAILDAVHAAASQELIDLPALGSNLRLLKSYLKLADVVVTNDTGPRHLAAALGTPVVSMFGPTDPAWTALDVPHERVIRSPDGAMTGIGVDTVFDAAAALLSANPPAPIGGRP